MQDMHTPLSQMTHVQLRQLYRQQKRANPPLPLPTSTFLEATNNLGPYTPTPAEVADTVRSFSNNFRKGLRAVQKSAAFYRIRKPIRSHIFKCERSLWRHFFWERLEDSERKKQGKGHYGLYHAEISSSSRLHQLFGEGSFFRELSTMTSFCFIAPKAYATQKWESAATGSLLLQQGDYVAVLSFVPNSNFVVVFKPEPLNSLLTVEYKGHQIYGRIGFCSLSVLKVETPFCIKYSPRTNNLKVICASWVFSPKGRLLSSCWTTTPCSLSE
jgi:hypothetical protein